MANVAPTLMVKVPDVFEKVTEAAPASEVTVMVCPFSMYTTSPATGNEAPDAPPDEADQVEVEFQDPLATEYRDALNALECIRSSNAVKTVQRDSRKFLVFMSYI